MSLDSDSPLSATPADLLVASMAAKSLINILFHAVVGVGPMHTDWHCEWATGAGLGKRKV